MSVALMAECAKIRSHPENPRQVLRNIDELAASIREHGLIQPVVLSADLDRPEGHYLLHAGHRRLAAFRKLGIKTIPATLRRVPDSRRTEVMLVENLQRDNLTPVEVGRALVALQAMHNPPLTQADMARRLGKSPGWVNQMLLFAELGDEDSEAMAAGELTWAQAVVEARERKQVRGGRVISKSERADDRASRGWYLAFSHDLARDAQLVCDWSGHSRQSGRRIGNVACGACWEATIRADERGGVDAIDRLIASITPDIDRVIVEAIADVKAPNVSGNPAERYEALRVMLAAGIEPVAALNRLNFSPRDRQRVLDNVERINALYRGDALATA